ncbi:MAG: type II toxin-antitoxin system VapC family toxin [Pirellulaceae bacterium]|nr:type II toxin-antitoxin system VapC family toxin [Pirellulaceae bacterium]
MSFFLDTDTFNHFHAGHPIVRARVVQAKRDELAITIITRIEVLQGRFEFVRKAASATQLLTAQGRLTDSDRALAGWRIVPLDSAACAEFDRLRGIKGIRKIGRADLLIACIVLANDATLVTRNVRDFAVIPSLKIENWVD